MLEMIVRDSVKFALRCFHQIRRHTRFRTGSPAAFPRVRQDHIHKRTGIPPAKMAHARQDTDFHSQHYFRKDQRFRFRLHNLGIRWVLGLFLCRNRFEF
jgi:hypothetical protein